MKRFFKGFYMTLGMFCAVPLPRLTWDDSCLDLVLCCLPVAGALIGALWWGLAWLLRLSHLHIMLKAAILTVAPFLLTGFLHLDGYLDTSDAVLSRRPLEEKLRILKDPHKGAFAVAMATVLFVLQFAAVYAAIDGGQKPAPLILIAVISRCCAALSLLCLKAMPQSGYANMFKQHTGPPHRVFLIVFTTATIAVSYPLAGLPGLAAVLAAVACFVGAMAYAYKEFKGVSGDLAGFALVAGELGGLVAWGVIR